MKTLKNNMNNDHTLFFSVSWKSFLSQNIQNKAWLMVVLKLDEECLMTSVPLTNNFTKGDFLDFFFGKT